MLEGRCTKRNGLIRHRSLSKRAEESTSWMGSRNYLLIRQGTTLDRTDGRSKSLRQLSETASLPPVGLSNCLTSFMAKLREGWPTNPLAFRQRVAHSGSDALDDQTSLKLGDGAENCEDHLARRR